jgi:LmbE family N-acetylglucosaminyl deacetylase
VRLLVVAAHPDDEVLGCGGTVASLSPDHEVTIAILGEGITSRQVSREDADAAAIDEVRAHAADAARIIGVTDLRMLGLPDNRFDEMALLDVVKQVEGLVTDVRPEAIYTHHPADLNVDHQVTFRAVLTATRPLAGAPVRDIYSFEVASSTEWAFDSAGATFKPNVFVEITKTIKTKEDAMSAYREESRDFPHPRSLKALRARARHWGSVAGVDYAEAFQLVRSIRPEV